MGDPPHLFHPPSCQPIPPLLLLLLWLALGGGAWRGWCGMAWLSMVFEGGRRSVPSSLLCFYPARLLALPPAAAVCASAVKEVALDVRVLPKSPP